MQNRGMHEHVLAAVSGHGLRVIPSAPPYRIVLGATAHAIEVHVDRGGATLIARVIADGTGGYRTGLGEGTPSVADVLDVEEGSIADAWQIDTSDFRCALPAGFVLCSSAPDAPTAFDLVNPDGSVVFVQTPAKLPALTRMCGPDQRVSGSGARWVELTYLHDGLAWWQRHEIVGRHLVTAQALASFAAGALTAARAMIDSLVDR